MIDVLAIFLTLLMLMFFAYRGVTVLILAPLLAMLAMLLTGGTTPILVGLSNTFMPALAGFIKAYFPIFLTGALFGKLMGDSGAATTIAEFFVAKLGEKHAILSVVISTAILTYGGVSLFVVVFAMYPIGAALFRKCQVPKRLLPACITLGAFTFTMTSMPGSPQAINTLPIAIFNTNIYAAPVLGLLGSAIMLGLGTLWINYRCKKAKAAGEGYGDHVETFSIQKEHDHSIMAAVTPILMVFFFNLVLTLWYFKSAGVVAKYTAAGAKINGSWPVIISLAIAIVFILIRFRKYLIDPKQSLFQGATGCLLPIFNTASEVGYGSVIKSLAGFAALKSGLVAMKLPPLVKVVIASTSLAGIVGSSSGGTAITLSVLGKDFLATGIPPEVLHRIVIMAAGGLDTLPHCGAVITLLSVCSLNHKQSYADIAIVTMAIPLVAVFTAVIFYLTTGVY